MPRIVIDGREVEVPDGATILDAAGRAGIDIPTLCFLPGCAPSTSCMVCVVKLRGEEQFVPACATEAVDGMQVDSETPEVREARRTSLELLLGDHLGDCEAPCHVACPAHMNIPLMIRQIAAGRLDEAIATVKKDIPLAAALGRICPAPCEKACRRGARDEAVAICLLKRCSADADLASQGPYLPECRPANGRAVAIVGAGPTGLSAAYYLLQAGYACTIFDDHDAPGGMLRYGVGEDRLPRDVLDAEIDLIARLGAVFRMGVKVDRDPSLADLREGFDAVLAAIGEAGDDPAKAMGLETGPAGIAIDRDTYQAGEPGVFAGGGAVRKGRLAVRAVADGKAAAACIDQYLSGREVAAPKRPFSTHIGRLREGEGEAFMVGVSQAGREDPSAQGGGLTARQARAEATRCLHCDCRKPDDCKLRTYAALYGARPGRFRGQRRSFQQQADHPEVIYEPGKCISCGLCVQISAAAGEPLGMTFIGRGFGTRVAVPFGEDLAAGLGKAAAECVRACPTGALAFRDGS